MYKQVSLSKGLTSQVAWIPEHLAHIGKIVKIKDDDGWSVEAVYQNHRLSEDELLEYERDHLHQRKASDI